MSDLQEAIRQMEACVLRGDKGTALVIAELLSDLDPVEWKKALTPVDPQVKTALLAKLDSVATIENAVHLCKLAQLNVQETKPHVKRFILAAIAADEWETLKKYEEYV